MRTATTWQRMKRSAGLLSTEDNKRMRDRCAGWPEGRNSPPQGGIKHQSLHLLHLRATEKAREQGEHETRRKGAGLPGPRHTN